MDFTGEIDSHTPWVGETVDSALLREQGWKSPGAYFLSRFAEMYQGEYERVLYGIHAHENNGQKDQVPISNFVFGRTYYTGLASLDAPLSYPLDTNAYDIYRFTWKGDNTDLYFTPSNCTRGEW